MTGDELRAALESAGISPNQFAERVARAKAPSGTKKAENAKRSAKRWISGKKSQQHLRLSSENRAIVVEVAGLDPARLLNPRPSAVEVRLAKLEAQGSREARALRDLTRRLTTVEAKLGEPPPQQGRQPRARGGP